jgi:transposase-like protein
MSWKRNLPASVAQRMRIVLLLDERTSYRDIEEKLGAAPSTVSRWKQRYEKDGVLGLATIHPGPPPAETHVAVARQGAGADAASATGWVHTLVATQDGGGDESQ